MHFIYIFLSEQKQLNSLVVRTEYLATSKYFLLIIIRTSLLWIGTPNRICQPFLFLIYSYRPTKFRVLVINTPNGNM